MWELYLISRLDAMLFVFISISVVVAFILFVSGIDYIHDGKGELNSRCFKYSAILLSIFGTLAMITPTKKDALLILGLGTTIDYLQSNEKVQELPDKCVDALDAWLGLLNGKED